MAVAKRPETDLPVHPGKLLGEELECRGVAPEALASLIGRDPAHVAAVIAQQAPMTADLALDIETALDVPAYFWMGLQGSYELTLARNARAGRRSA